MINTTNQTTTVKFAKNNLGKISVCATGTKLTLQQLASNNYQLGDEVKITDVAELPKIEMEFFKEESIDVMIKALERIRHNLKRNYKSFKIIK